MIGPRELQITIDCKAQEWSDVINTDRMTGEILARVASAISRDVGVPCVVVPNGDGFLAYPVPR